MLPFLESVQLRHKRSLGRRKNISFSRKEEEDIYIYLYSFHDQAQKRRKLNNSKILMGTFDN